VRKFVGEKQIDSGARGEARGGGKREAKTFEEKHGGTV